MLGRGGYATRGNKNLTTLERLKEYKESFLGRSWLSFTKESLQYDKDGNKITDNGRHLHKKERIRVDTYFYDDEIYSLGVFCIKFGRSRGAFVKEAVFEKMNRVKAEHKQQVKQSAIHSLFGCPKCESFNIQTISTKKKTVKCEECKHTWVVKE